MLLGLALTAACPGTTNTPEDSGTILEPDSTLQSCETVDDCPDPANYDCLGVCYQRCAANEVCRANEYCSERGYCEEGCRDSSTCNEGEVCAAGTCQTSGGNVCGSKCDCLPGEVCNAGTCSPPPAMCASSDDCGRGAGDVCDAYQCNGFTQLCFDPNPQPCANDTDCDARPGCADGCICNASSQCVPSVACTPEDELDTCGNGYYCTAGNTCDVAPACTDDSDCESIGLECNQGTGVCQRSQPCTDNAECTVPPATFCDVAAGNCVVPDCNNGGATCQNGYTCSEAGTCVPAGTGVPCNSDADCSNDPWPDTQFCSFDSGSGECASGCRNNSSCPDGQTCNGARQCVDEGGGGNPGGNGGQGEACEDFILSSDCQAGFQCLLFGTCAEQCDPAVCEPAGNCCPLSGGTCIEGAIVNYCL